MALTATAIPKVVDDIQEKLHFQEKNVFRKSFERKNILYLVRQVDDKQKYLIETLKKVKGSGIIYVRNRKKTRETAIFLRKNNVSADYYHAGLKHEIRNKKQNEWKTGKIRVMVSTNAFGMGIDKSDVRFVIHLDLPDSIESYFQEAGRGVSRGAAMSLQDLPAGEDVAGGEVLEREAGEEGEATTSSSFPFAVSS